MKLLIRLQKWAKFAYLWESLYDVSCPLNGCAQRLPSRRSWRRNLYEIASWFSLFGSIKSMSSPQVNLRIETSVKILICQAHHIIERLWFLARSIWLLLVYIWEKWYPSQCLNLCGRHDYLREFSCSNYRVQAVFIFMFSHEIPWYLEVFLGDISLTEFHGNISQSTQICSRYPCWNEIFRSKTSCFSCGPES